MRAAQGAGGPEVRPRAGAPGTAGAQGVSAATHPSSSHEESAASAAPAGSSRRSNGAQIPQSGAPASAASRAPASSGSTRARKTSNPDRQATTAIGAGTGAEAVLGLRVLGVDLDARERDGAAAGGEAGLLVVAEVARDRSALGGDPLSELRVEHGVEGVVPRGRVYTERLGERGRCQGEREGGERGGDAQGVRSWLR